MPLTHLNLFGQLGLSVLLGLLVGLQREHDARHLAGLRTFPLITVLGTVAAWLDQHSGAGGWMITAGLLSVVIIMVIGNLQEIRSSDAVPGLTTEFAMLLMFAVGAYLVFGEPIVAVAITGGIAVLLEFKPQLHGFVARLTNDDLRAIMQFVLITCVILPVLPNQAYDPFEVVNPFEAWLMVVLVVGLSLAGYILYKFLGKTAGSLLAGVLGGAVSSTATTATYARIAKQETTSRLAGVVIAIASTVTYLRALVDIAAVSPAFLLTAAPPIGCMFLAAAVMSVGAWIRHARERAKLPALENPTELRSALFFGGLYVVVLFGLAVARHWFGDRGLYLPAVLSGLADVDAITLSTARLVRQGGDGGLSPTVGWRMVVAAIMANLLFKAGMVALLGSRALLVTILILFAAPLITGALLLALWPDQWMLPGLG